MARKSTGSKFGGKGSTNRDRLKEYSNEMSKRASARNARGNALIKEIQQASLDKRGFYMTSDGRGGVRTVRSSDTRTGSPATSVMTSFTGTSVFAAYAKSKVEAAKAEVRAEAAKAEVRAEAAKAEVRAEADAASYKALAAQVKAAKAGASKTAKAKAAKAEVRAKAAKARAGSSIAASGKPGPGGEKTTPISANRGGGGGGGDQPRVPAGDPDGGQWTI